MFSPIHITARFDELFGAVVHDADILMQLERPDQFQTRLRDREGRDGRVFGPGVREVRRNVCLLLLLFLPEDLAMGELLDALNKTDRGPAAGPGNPLDRAAQAFGLASQRVNEAIEAVQEPGTP